MQNFLQNFKLFSLSALAIVISSISVIEVLEVPLMVETPKEEFTSIAEVELRPWVEKYNSEMTIEELLEKKAAEVVIVDDPAPEVEVPIVNNEVPIPHIPSNVYLCTDYRYYNLPYTPHWRLQQRAWTDELGCRRFNNDYIVGLGSGYTVNIGERYAVYLDNGTYFTIIMGDSKADCDTDLATHTYTPCYNYAGEAAANVLEFIIDSYVMESAAYNYGGLHYYPQFQGNILKMVYLGRDTSGDWDTYV